MDLMKVKRENKESLFSICQAPIKKRETHCYSAAPCFPVYGCIFFFYAKIVMFRMDYVLPADVPWKWAKKPYQKVRKGVIGAEKKMWKAAYKGMMKNYTSPLYDTVFFPSSGSQASSQSQSQSQSQSDSMPRRFARKRRISSSPWKRNMKRKCYAKRTPVVRRRKMMGRRNRVYTPVFSLDAMAMKNRFRPRAAINTRPRVDRSIAPKVTKVFDDRVWNWPNNTQGVFSHTFLGKAELDGLLAKYTQTDGPWEQGTLSNYKLMVRMKNMTNNPIEVQLYRFSYKRDSSYSIDQLWDQGLADYVNAGTGWAKTQIGFKPQQSDRLMRAISLTKGMRYKLGGGGQVTFPMFMKGPRHVSRGLIDNANDLEYMKGYSFGFLLITQGTLVVDTAGTSSGLSSGRLAVFWEGHQTLKVAENNVKDAGSTASIPTLTGEQTMNVDSDVVQAIAKA